jgi:hypothetical protein
MKTALFTFSLVLALPAFATEPAAVASPAAALTSPAPAAPAKNFGTVTRAQFTSAVQDHEPVDKITTLTNDKTRILFFTELKDMAGQKVGHRWEYNDKVMLETRFEVGSDRWRVFSAKTLYPSWTGEWKVSVVDQAGGTLGASTFTYAIPEMPAARPAAPPKP